MKYNQYAIESLKDKLIELSMKSSTPKKYAANMFEAYEVIKQLQREIKDKETAGDKELDLESWNTRPAPPIGRCGECRNWNEGDCYRQELTKSTDYCSYFEPREELL